MFENNEQWSDDALGSLETLVSSIDELPEGFDCESLPDEIRTILNYINLQCRALVKRAE